jgi:hypothetical protein
LLRTNQKFEEIRVVQGVAERTGNLVDRSVIRGRSNVCRSVTELARKVRSDGDGYFYLAASAWPEATTHLELSKAWTPMS